MPRSLLLVLATGLLGCSSQDGSERITWHADIHPMMQQHCTRCHTDAGLGVGDYSDLDQVRAFSEVMLARMDEGEMPPPAADPTCRDYHGSERMSLPPASLEAFRSWVEDGMPEGDPADAVTVETPPMDLDDRADLTLLMDEPYAPAFSDPQNPGNEYRCFALEHGQEDDFFITGFHPVVGEPALVHHALLFAMDRDRIPASYDPSAGVDCMEGRGGPFGDLQGMVAGWAPGMEPTVFEDGRGILIREDQVLVVQLHYYRSGPEVDGLTDRSGYQLITADQVDVPLRMVPLGTFDFAIPPGDPAYSHEDSFALPAGLSGRVHAVFPHMHILGSAYRTWISHGDGSETCVARGRYDFDNQLSYVLKEPVSIGSGDRIHLECTWDNSADNPDRIFDEPRTIRFGERTDEEMCFAFSLVSIGQ